MKKSQERLRRRGEGLMAWTAEKVKEMRESNPSKAAESSGWTAEKVRAIRTKTPNPSTASSTVLPKSNIYADALQQYTERHASDMGEVDARNEPSQARSGRKENLSPFPSADAARERSSPVRQRRRPLPAAEAGGVLGPWPAGRECRSRHEMDAGSHNPIAFLKGKPGKQKSLNKAHE